jgi:hypothetical protein
MVYETRRKLAKYGWRTDDRLPTQFKQHWVCVVQAVLVHRRVPLLCRFISSSLSDREFLAHLGTGATIVGLSATIGRHLFVGHGPRFEDSGTFNLDRVGFSLLHQSFYKGTHLDALWFQRLLHWFTQPTKESAEYHD